MHRVPKERTFGAPIPNSLSTIFDAFKASVTRRINKISKSHKSIWQRNYFEHIIRNDEDLYRIRKYIRHNPLKWQLDEYYEITIVPFFISGFIYLNISVFLYCKFINN